MQDTDAEKERRELASAIVSLNVALKNLALYGPEHSTTALRVTEAFQDLAGSLSRRSKIVLKIVEADLVFEEGRLVEDLTPVQALMQAFAGHGVQSFSFIPGLKESEVTYIDGKRIGTWMRWDMQGKLVGMRDFPVNKPSRQGTANRATTTQRPSTTTRRSSTTTSARTVR